MSKIVAKFIGETSAGQTVVQIYDDDKLVWSCRWFDNGATESTYRSGLRDAYECMVDAKDYLQYAGCAIDDDGSITDYDCTSTTYVALTYDPDTNQWISDRDTLGDGQTVDFIRYNSDRLPGNIFDLIAK
jgi:hypothetical protein